jgi:hypothetical protein
MSGEIDLMLEALVVHLKAGDTTHGLIAGQSRAAFCLF